MPRKSVILLCSLLVLLLVGACGKKGSPLPKGLPIPQDIRDLRGDVRDSVLLLSFTIPTKNRDGTEVKNLEGFKIMRTCRRCVGGFELLKNIRLTDSRGFTIVDGRFYTYDNDLQPGLEYGYRVVPYAGKDMELDPSNIFSIKWEAVPVPPGDASASDADGSLVLSWKKQEGLLYNVYRREGESYPLFPVNPGPFADATFTVGGLENGKTYTFEVRAVRMVGTIPFEGEGTTVSGTPRDRTPPAPPANFVAERKNGAIRLSWEPNKEPDLKGYYVYRETDGKPERLQKEPLQDTAYLETYSGKQRYVTYYVTAVDKAGNESGPSREQVVVLRE